MRCTIVGCGDAFGSGGRLQTCFHVKSETRTFLIDCGATSLTGLAREGLNPDAIDTIFTSHLHGDHYAGLVFLILQAQFVTKRSRPLAIVGPAGLQDRVRLAADALFPKAKMDVLAFELTYHAFDVAAPLAVGDIRAQVWPGAHPSGALSALMRLEHEGRTISFSGDTEWVDALIPCASGADLLITECYAPQAGVRYHLNWETLSQRLTQLCAKRILMTHMNAAMLGLAATLAGSDPRVTFAQDGMVIEI